MFQSSSSFHRTPFKVRLGEWDASNDNEPIPAVEVQTATIFIHPKYNAKNLQYDIALIRLASNAPLGEYPTITNICLPSKNLDLNLMMKWSFYFQSKGQPISNMRCWVSGEILKSPAKHVSKLISLRLGQK